MCRTLANRCCFFNYVGSYYRIPITFNVSFSVCINDCSTKSVTHPKFVMRILKYINSPINSYKIFSKQYC